MTTPYVGNEGNVLGTFPEQTPCLEHQNSVFIEQGVECQTCHMPEASTPVIISTLPRNLPPREPFVQHYFVGGNKIILDILNENSEELGVTASDAHFQETITNLLDLLQNETAQISIQEAEASGDQITVKVNVDQIIGHKFPTGFPSRRAWIHMTVADKNGSVIFESGNHDNEGRIIGCDADYDAAAYEPHYDIISHDDQVQIYESVMQDFEGNVTYTLLKGAAYAKDNRLLPPGFDIENAIANIAIYGKATNDSNFIAGSDRVEYRIDTGGKSGPYTIKVELLYQTISYRFVQDLLTDDDKELVDTFGSLYDKTDKSPILISSATQTIQ